jgi:hypothetical protein
MTIYQFRASSPHLQHALVATEGVFLLKRPSGAGTALLYQLNDFYVEIIYAAKFQSRGIIRCLSVKEIQPYLRQIDVSTIQHLLQ